MSPSEDLYYFTDSVVAVWSDVLQAVASVYISGCVVDVCFLETHGVLLLRSLARSRGALLSIDVTYLFVNQKLSASARQQLHIELQPHLLKYNPDGADGTTMSDLHAGTSKLHSRW